MIICYTMLQLVIVLLSYILFHMLVAFNTIGKENQSICEELRSAVSGFDSNFVVIV